MWLQISAFESLLASSGVAAAFVGSLYLWKQSQPSNDANEPIKTRDHPDVIKQRVLSIGIVTVLAPLVLCIWSADAAPASVGGGEGVSFATWIGVPNHSYLPALFLPLGVTAVLFIGPLLVMTGLFDNSPFITDPSPSGTGTGTRSVPTPDKASPSESSDSSAAGAAAATPSSVWSRSVDAVSRHEYVLRLQHDTAFRWIVFRNVLVAPVCEEFVFRAIICSLLIAGGWGFAWTVLGSPVLFGVAHLHHLIGLVQTRGYSLVQGLVAVTFQLMYTTLFGAFAGFVYLRTGHVIAPILCHMFCNVMGFPDLSFMRDRNQPLRKWSILGVHVLGIIGFAVLLYPLTEPALYDCFFASLF